MEHGKNFWNGRKNLPPYRIGSGGCGWAENTYLTPDNTVVFFWYCLTGFLAITRQSSLVLEDNELLILVSRRDILTEIQVDPSILAY